MSIFTKIGGGLLKIVKGGPLAKVDVSFDQIQDKMAERGVALGIVIAAVGFTVFLILWGWSIVS